MRRSIPARRGPHIMPAGLVVASLLALVGLTALTSLTACTGGDPDPAPTTLHPGTPATPTATPSANPTDLAATAAIAAVQRLYAEYNAMLKSGSSSAYRLTFTNTCTFCRGNARRVDEIARRHQTIQGGAVSLRGLTANYVHGATAFVDGYMTDSPATVRQSGRIVDRFAGGTSVRFSWRVQFRGDAWLVTQEQVIS